MKAVILSGGFGTRMRPLTFTRPKPLLPLLGIPMVDHIIDSLPQEVDEAIMAANYLIDQLRAHFDERNARGDGPFVRVVDEPEPRGTGGAVKNAEEYLDEAFFVFNGDIICSLDLEVFIDFHRRKGGIGSLSVWRVEDPSRFGVVRFEDDGRVGSFVEKPQPAPGEHLMPEWINAGVYAFEPEILDHIEPGRKVSSEREVFPKVLDKGLFAMKFDGYWVDAGKPRDYLEAQRVLLDRRMTAGSGGISMPDGEKVEPISGPFPQFAQGPTAPSQTYAYHLGLLKPPVMLEGGCNIGPGALVGPHVCLGRDVIIGSSATVSGSALFAGAQVGEGAIVMGAILGEGARVGARALVEEGSVLEEGEEVGEGVVRKADVNRTE